MKIEIWMIASQMLTDTVSGLSLGGPRRQERTKLIQNGGHMFLLGMP